MLDARVTKEQPTPANTVALRHLVAQNGAGAGPSRRPPRIGIWGHYHGGNQGDDLVVATLIDNIRARVPNAEILGFCVNPADTRERHGIPAFPIYRPGGRVYQPTRVWTSSEQTEHGAAAGPFGRVRAFIRRRPAVRGAFRAGRTAWRAACAPLRSVWRAAAAALSEIPFLARSYRTLRGVDLLIVPGSQVLYDGWHGPWAHPFALFKWSILARLAGTSFIGPSIGGGPVNGRLARWFTRRGLRSMSYTSYRDPSSARFVEALGAAHAPRIVPDMGFILDAVRFADLRPRPPAMLGRIVVGLNPMAHSDPRYFPRSDPRIYQTYIRKTAEFAAWLLQEGYAVVLLYSQIRADPRACVDLHEILQRDHAWDGDAPLIEQPIDGYAELSSMLSWCDYVVAARYHCIVLPFLLGKPVVALGYHPKHRDLMELMGQGNYCLDINAFTTSALIERFQALQRNGNAIRAELAQRVPDCRARVAAQFDELLRPFRTLPSAGRGTERPIVASAAR